MLTDASPVPRRSMGLALAGCTLPICLVCPVCPQAVSVYGYSLTSFLLAAPLCVLSGLVRWLGLAAASVCAGIFVLRSAWPRLQETTPEKSTMVLLGGVFTFHLLWFVLLVFS